MWEAIVIVCAVAFKPTVDCPAKAAVIDLNGPYGSEPACMARVREMRWALRAPKLTNPTRECELVLEFGTTRQVLERKGIADIRYCLRQPGNPCAITGLMPSYADRLQVY